MKQNRTTRRNLEKLKQKFRRFGYHFTDEQYDHLLELRAKGDQRAFEQAMRDYNKA